MVRRTRTWSRQTLDVVTILALEVAAGRRERRMRLSDLADRAGTSPMTVRRIEQGDPTVAIGTVFEVARLVGVRFFDADRDRLGELVDRGRDRLAVLPARVREPTDEVDDAF
jgi:transcriptional regulator with XRE-family HTH domain